MKNIRPLYWVLSLLSFLGLSACGDQPTNMHTASLSSTPSPVEFPNRTVRPLFQKSACLSRIFHVDTNVHPDPSSDLTAHEEASTFQVDESNRRLNAYWLAAASMLSYGRSSLVKNELESYWGAKKVTFFEKHQTAPRMAVQAFVADIPHDARYDLPARHGGVDGATQDEPAHMSVGDMTIVAFRGTQVYSIGDVSTDIRGASIPMQMGRVKLGHVHQGFLESLDAVWDDMLAEVKRTKRPIWVTGHSLGAALATLFTARAMALNDPDVRIAGLYTFGSPRVGLKDFAKVFNELAIDQQVTLRRYVNRYDLVPMVPDKVTGIPANGILHSLLTAWTHVGLANSERDTLIWYNDDHIMLNGEALANMPTSLWQFGREGEGIKDHKPDVYMARTEADAFGSITSCPLN